MSVYVGSWALASYGLNRLEPKDKDKWYLSWENWDPGIDGMIVPDEIFDELETHNGFATPDTVYTIKCSHLGWDIHWQKTKLDIVWLKAKGCTILWPLYELLVEHWRKVNGNKDFLSLTQDKREFFNDHVTYVYDHDYLHELVAYPNPPMYSRCLKDGEDVLIDRAKFDLMPFEDQIRLFREEICAISIERWLVNPAWKGKFSIGEAYRLALKKTLVSLTKNWAADFIATNMDKFYRCDLSYFEHAAGVLGIDTMTITFKEIKESYNAATGEDVDEYSFADGLGFYSNDEKKWEKDHGYQHFDQEGGGEGGAEYCFTIFEFDGKILKLEYSYYSHHGYDFGCAEIKEVTASEKTVTVYS